MQIHCCLKSIRQIIAFHCGLKTVMSSGSSTVEQWASNQRRFLRNGHVSESVNLMQVKDALTNWGENKNTFRNLNISMKKRVILWIQKGETSNFTHLFGSDTTLDFELHVFIIPLTAPREALCIFIEYFKAAWYLLLFWISRQSATQNKIRPQSSTCLKSIQGVYQEKLNNIISNLIFY